MELNVHVKGDTREEILARLEEAVEIVRENREAEHGNPNITIQHGGGGGP